ncbi:MAG: glycosyltransferase [Roseobacter sp.]
MHAPNVHQGGGRTLLLPLLEALPRGSRAHLDTRLLAQNPAIPDDVDVYPTPPSLLGRYNGERMLREVSQANDTVLCFGNLPPLFSVPAKVRVFLQNRYLVSDADTSPLPLKTRLRLVIERGWLKRFARDAEIIVQTPTMAHLVKQHLGRDARSVSFVPEMPAAVVSTPQYDYLYVASPEGHKNHKRLLEAWMLMAAEDTGAPTLALTLSPAQAGFLAPYLSHLKDTVTLEDPRGRHEMPDLYASAQALIYPSLFESFGLPLLEAAAYGLPILAAERDYVRDVVVPSQTFDPASAVSIARAVRRHQKVKQPIQSPVDAQAFLETLTREDPCAS